jgi:hypothetical protein
MADADWARYKQIRGRDLPETLDWAGQTYSRVHILKRDFYAAVGIYSPTDCSGAGGPSSDSILYKVYHADDFGPIALGWLGRFLCRREIHFLRRLADVPGVPKLRQQVSPTGFVREFVPGCNLREYARNHTPDERFFPELKEILKQVHDLGISHNDLSKPENVLVTLEGRPVLIDFQIALDFQGRALPVLGWLLSTAMRYFQRIDRYHVTKIHRRRRPDDFAPEEIAQAKKKGWLLHLHGHIRKPYRAVRHRVLMRLTLPEAEPPIK